MPQWTFNPFTGELDAMVGSINEIPDVTITSAATYDILQYNGTAWVNSQDLEVLGTGDIKLKVGGKIIFDGE